MTIRRMNSMDLDSVIAIEEVSFISPWNRKSFEFELARKGGMPLVAEENRMVVGYVVAWRVVDEIHIANLAVRPEWRRRKVGQTLLEELVGLSSECSWIGLEVRVSNLPARSLYQKLGFKEVGIRKKYYMEENEDAVLMTKFLDPVKR
jgi:ribosomal-protein-alanine N-acetyltransferase